jgi:hypothetical protein
VTDVVQHYTVLADATIEEVIEVDYERRRITTTHNILPAETSQDVPPQVARQPEQDSVDPPLADVFCAAPPPPTKKQRSVKGLIRAMWTAVFSFGGEALVYALNNLTALELPPGVGLAVGAVGYGVKAAVFPNSKL